MTSERLWYPVMTLLVFMVSSHDITHDLGMRAYHQRICQALISNYGNQEPESKGLASVVWKQYPQKDKFSLIETFYTLQKTYKCSNDRVYDHSFHYSQGQKRTSSYFSGSLVGQWLWQSPTCSISQNKMPKHLQKFT